MVLCLPGWWDEEKGGSVSPIITQVVVVAGVVFVIARGHSFGLSAKPEITTSKSYKSYRHDRSTGVRDQSQ